jgi:ATP-dependent RNA helicase SUPV3L1/SUV3
MSPIPWNDAAALDIVVMFYRQYRNQSRVDLVECLRASPLGHLEDVEMCMKDGPPRSSHRTLGQLESLHKLLVLYMWMQQRVPVAWCDHVEVIDLKERTERALDWSLQGISWGTQSRRLPDLLALRQRNMDQRISYIDQHHLLKLKEAKRNGFRAAVKELVPVVGH